MVYARVIRALQAAGDLDERQLVESLNKEFRIFGICVDAEDVRQCHSALEISQAITAKIAYVVLDSTPGQS